MRKSLRILVAGTVSALLAGGTAVARTTGDQPSGQAGPNPSSGQTTPRIDNAAAVQIAQGQLPGAVVTDLKLELDDDNEQDVWEVDLTRQNREYEVTIDAVTGTILSVDHEDIDVDGRDETDQESTDDNSAITSLPVPRIGSAAAERLAQNWVGSATVTELHLDGDHGQIVWEVDLTRQEREYEVTIDADTGSVLDGRQDDDN